MWNTVWVVFFLSSNKKTFLTKEKRQLRAGLQKTVSRKKATVRQHCAFAQALSVGSDTELQLTRTQNQKFGFSQLAINFMATSTSLNHCLQHVSSAELQALRMM